MVIIVRHAKDDFGALLTAQGIEDAGAQVFSVTLNHTHNHTHYETRRFLVFARYDPDSVTPDQIDEHIQKLLYPS
jgi:hypothetical protein